MENSNKKSSIDVAVLLIFFNRPALFKKVFEQVKIARPSKLFLYQDGAREGNEKDIENVKRCREIAEDIDWECEVYEMYQEKNVGCDPSEYIAQKWAFGIVDKCIVLEDDDVPSQSFFPYCKELLDKYENDTRINMICGMNQLGIYENTEYDYVYSHYGAIWGWASWRRVIDSWSVNYELLDSKISRKKFVAASKNKRTMKSFLKTVERHKNSEREHYESIMAYNMMINNTINIVPKKNMISNIGNTCEESTHSCSSEKVIAKGSRRILSMPIHEIDFPIKHPPYVMEDVEFTKRYTRIMGFGHPMVNFYRRVSHWLLLIRYGQFNVITHKLKKKLGMKY